MIGVNVTLLRAAYFLEGRVFAVLAIYVSAGLWLCIRECNSSRPLYSIILISCGLPTRLNRWRCNMII